MKELLNYWRIAKVKVNKGGKYMKKVILILLALIICAGGIYIIMTQVWLMRQI